MGFIVLIAGVYQYFNSGDHAGAQHSGRFQDGTCDLELVLSIAAFFGLSPSAAKAIARQVADAAPTWRDVAGMLGARECKRMRTAFGHADMDKALRL